MEEFIKNIPHIDKAEETYLNEKCTDKNILNGEDKNARNETKEKREDEHNELFEKFQRNEEKEDNFEKETKMLNKKNLEKEEKEDKEEKEMIKEKNAILKEKEKWEKREAFDVDELKTERNCYSDNYVRSDVDKESSDSSSDGSSSSDHFESVESSEDESRSALESCISSNERDEMSDSVSISDSEEGDISSSEEEDDEDEENEDSEDSEDDDEQQEKAYSNGKDNKESVLEGKGVEEIKEIGNTYFKECDYFNAIYYYNKAIKKCKDNNTKGVLYSNRAACNILLKRWDAVIKDCTKSISYNDGFVKSYIRRSKAYEQLEKYNDASNDLNKAIELDPSLKSTHEKTQKKLAILAEQQLNKEKEEMMGKLKDFGNLLLGKVGLSLDNFEVQKNPNNDGSFNIQFKQNK